jgi:hypothetical protein
MKERPILFSGPMVRAILEGRKTQTRRIVKPQPLCIASGEWIMNGSACKYGKPGDRLWVRETWWAPRDDVRGEYKREYIKYAATLDGMGQPTWKPSIHMPRWASRINLEVVSVRVERLQNISEEDARAEGIWQPNWPLSWRQLWESINGAGSWEANPWVWVVEFKRIER